MAYSSKFDIPDQNLGFDYGKQANQTRGFLDRYSSAIRGQDSVSKMADVYGSNLMLPEQRENIKLLNEQLTTVGGQLRGLPQQVSDTTKNSLVTEGQRARMVQSQAQPLQQTMADLTGSLSQAQANYGMSQDQLNAMIGYELAGQQKELLPFEMEYDSMTQQQAREFSGYTFNMQQELERLLANQSAGLTWTNAEEQRAADLAQAEMGYKARMREIKEQGRQTRLTNEPSNYLAAWTAKQNYG